MHNKRFVQQSRGRDRRHGNVRSPTLRPDDTDRAARNKHSVYHARRPEEYVQMPMPEMAWHEAPDGQPPLPEPGWQIRAHWVGEEEPGFSRTHSGLAVVPVGAAGHGQDGEQKEPDTPVICTASSPDEQVPDADGFSYAPSRPARAPVLMSTVVAAEATARTATDKGHKHTHTGRHVNNNVSESCIFVARWTGSR